MLTKDDISIDRVRPLLFSIYFVRVVLLLFVSMYDPR